MLYSQNYQSPESIVWHSETESHYISNTESGTIGKLDFGEIVPSTFVDSLNGPAGLHIIDNTLFVADRKVIRAFDLSNGEEVWSLEILESSLLNDITSLDSNTLFVSGFLTGKLYKIDIAEQTYEAVQEGLLVANGVFYNENNNELLLVEYVSTSPKVYATSLNDTLVLEPVATISSGSGLDGIAFDGTYYYISSFLTNTIFQMDQLYNVADSFVLDIDTPADIYFDMDNELLCVPFSQADTIAFYGINELFPNTVINGLDNRLENTEITVSPNPVFLNNNNIELSINTDTPDLSDLLHSNNVDIAIYNNKGQKVSRQFTSNNQNKINIELNNQLASGNYYLRIQSENGKIYQSKLLILN